MANTLLTEGDLLSCSLGRQVGENYLIHEETAQVLHNINKRLNEEDKTLRIHRRALAFSKILQKDLIPILVASPDNPVVFDAVIRLLVNLTVPVECLCPLDIFSKSDAGRQTLFELDTNLVKSKETFGESKSTRVIMDWLTRQTQREKMSQMEITIVNNCLLLIRNILHISDAPAANTNKTSIQNQIMWNLFAQNLDKILLDLIQHKMSNIWCTSVVQMIALVYKDQHVITLQKLLQNFLETSLSESSEDNESNTSPHFQNGSCSPPSTDDQTSDDQTSRETSTSPAHRSRNNSIGSLEVLPNNSPAPSVESPAPSPPSPVKPLIPAETVDKPEPGEESSHNSGGESGVGSEPMSINEGEPPPAKYFVRENDNGEKTLHGRNGKQITELVHKTRKSPKRRLEQHSASDSSDVTGVPKSSKLPTLSMAESSDYGYVTRESLEQTIEQEQQEMVSTSSNEDDHQHIRNVIHRTNPVKPRPKKGNTQLSPLETKEKQRLKLLKRSKENRIRVKAMVNHIPTDKDISELLKEFTVDFIHNGYSNLVEQLLEKLSIDEIDASMDKSHFLWLLTYFLKFASQMELGLDQIGSVLSFRTLSYLTFQGVELFETLELAKRERTCDLSPYLRRMHLVVTALREFIQTVSSYNEINLRSFDDKMHIERLQLQSVYTKEIRQLLLLLLRKFNPQLQTLQYLADLIMCNHMLLLANENVSESERRVGPRFDLTQHMKQFANSEMMRQYGRLLEEFEQNTPFVNDCIFTILHHMAGDLDSPQVLYIPSILQSFSKIWEQGLQICEDWVDLIEFIIQKFIQTMGSSPHSCAMSMMECLDYNDTVDECGFTGEQTSQLFWHFTQVENSRDPVGAIIEVYKQTDNISLSRLAVIQALLSQGIITHAQYMNFMYMKSVMYQCKAEHEGSVIAEVGSEHSIALPANSDGHITDSEEPADPTPEKNKNSEIQVLKDCLVKQGKESLIPWLQEVLLDACRVKMYPDTLTPDDSEFPHEPVPYYYNKAKKSIPLVPWNRNHYQGLQTEAFILLLHKLGFHLPADVGKVFPRIPHFWSADHIFTVASKIGAISKEKLKFSTDELERITKLRAESEAPAPATALDKAAQLVESMDLDLYSGDSKPIEDSSAWLNLAFASKKRQRRSSSITSSSSGMDQE